MCGGIVCAVLLMGASLVGAAQLIVDDDGVQYTNPDYYSIQDAINAASSGDTVTVYPGTYGPINFSGKDITVTSSDPSVIGLSIPPRNWYSVPNPFISPYQGELLVDDDTEYAIIDANYSGPCVKVINAETRDAVLRGFILINGTGETTSGSAISHIPEYRHAGNGILCEGSSPTNWQWTASWYPGRSMSVSRISVQDDIRAMIPILKDIEKH